MKFPVRTRNITESDERSLTLDILAFGLDKTIYHKIPLSTYLFTEQNLNTSTLSGNAQAHVRLDALFFFFFFYFNEKALPPFKSMYLIEYRKE